MSQADHEGSVSGLVSGVQGRTVLVTGSTSGLGEAMASALLQAGAEVCITGRDEARLSAAAHRLREKWPAASDRLLTQCMDVRSEVAVHEACRELGHRCGRIDVLINNAGIGMRTVNPTFQVKPLPFWSVPPEGFRDLMETNVTGYFLVSREIVPSMVEHGFGKVVNVTINRDTMTRRGFVPYGPSRAASEALSEIMARDLEGTGVTVNLLLPGGATLTGMIPEEVRPALSGSLLDADIMGPPAVWLASRESDAVTGERISAREFPAFLERRRSP